MIARVIVPRLPKYSLLPFVQLIRPSVSLVTVPTGRGGATETATFVVVKRNVLPERGEVRKRVEEQVAEVATGVELLKVTKCGSRCESRR